MVCSGCVIPTVSLHSYRKVTMTVTDARTRKPVPALPVEVRYGYNPTDSPIFFHWELRTLRDQKATTDAAGRAVLSLADYAWDIALVVDDPKRDYKVDERLEKDLIRKGGILTAGWPGTREIDHAHLRFLFELQKRPH
jgi:hypothetical protein